MTQFVRDQGVGKNDHLRIERKNALGPFIERAAAVLGRDVVLREIEIGGDQSRVCLRYRVILCETLALWRSATSLMISRGQDFSLSKLNWVVYQGYSPDNAQKKRNKRQDDPFTK